MNKKIIIGISLSFLLLAAIGFTFAYFIADITGNENAEDIIVETGTLSLVYKDGQELILNKAFPGDYVEKVFTVTNTGTLDTEYSINFINLINTITNNELVVSYTCKSYVDYVDVDNKGEISGTCLGLTNKPVLESELQTTIALSEGITIPSNITHEYKIRVTFKETNQPQDYNQGKAFSTKIYINESEESNLLMHKILKDNEVYADNVSSRYVSSSTGINFSKISSATNGQGLYYTTDTSLTEGGERVYYYRGEVENNYIVFANYCWRIIRTNEDGSIKLRYQAPAIESEGTYTCPTTTTAVATSQVFNAKYNDNAYLGWMHGTVGSSDYTATHKNTTNSDIKTVVDNWYASNIANNEKYHSKVANTIYCSDRSITSPTDMPTITLPSGTVYTNTGLGYAKNVTFYRGVKSFVNPVSNDTTNNFWVASEVQAPTYVCANRNDEFTLSVEAGGTNGYGNNALIYPVGLLTADEVVFAGGNFVRTDGSSTNNSYFLKPTTNWYWTMTPSRFDGSRAVVFLVSTVGHIGYYHVNTTAGSVLPAISLKSDVTVSSLGDGTSTNPYVVE